MSEISRGCPSSGWVLALTAGHPHLLSHWSEQAQAEVYGDDGDRAFPAARCRPARRCPRTAATPSAARGTTPRAVTTRRTSWAAPSCRGASRRGSLWLLIDRADFEIVDNWDVIGLRGTGSKRVVCEEVHVPEHRCITAVGTTGETAAGLAQPREPALRRRAVLASCSSSSAPSRSAPRAARSTSTRTSCGRKAARHPAVRPARRGRRVPASPGRGDRPASTSPRPRC